MKDFLKDAFEYHHHFNQMVLKMLKKHEESISPRSIPLFSHILNAHQIWNSRIMNAKAFGVHDLHTIDECMEIDEANFKISLSILSERDLDEKISYQLSSGDSGENYVKEMLFHVINHTTHHRGQIISDLRQKGLAPPITDYIYYKMK